MDLFSSRPPSLLGLSSSFTQQQKQRLTGGKNVKSDWRQTEGADGPEEGGVERLTGVLEGVDLHVQQRKGLSEAVRHRGLLLLEDLCHLGEEEEEG